MTNLSASPTTLEDSNTMPFENFFCDTAFDREPPAPWDVAAADDLHLLSGSMDDERLLTEGASSQQVPTESELDARLRLAGERRQELLRSGAGSPGAGPQGPECTAASQPNLEPLLGGALFQEQLQQQLLIEQAPAASQDHADAELDKHLSAAEARRSLFSPEECRIIPRPAQSLSCTPRTGVAAKLTTPAGQLRAAGSARQPDSGQLGRASNSLLTPFPGYVGPAGLLLTSPSPGNVARMPGRPQTAMPASAGRFQHPQGMRRALSLGPPAARPMPPGMPPPLPLSPPELPATPRLRLSSPDPSPKRRLPSPETEVDDQDDPEYVPSGVRRARGSKHSQLRREGGKPQQRSGGSADAVHQDGKRSRSIRNRKIKSDNSDDAELDDDLIPSRRPIRNEALHNEHGQLQKANKHIKGEMRLMLGKLEATLRENALIKRLVSGLTVQQQGKVEHSYCQELDAYRACLASSAAESAHTVQRPPWPPRSAEVQTQRWEASTSPTGPSGGSDTTRLGSASTESVRLAILPGIDEAAVHRARQILETSLPRMAGSSWPPLGTEQALSGAQARQVAAEALAASSNNTTDALAKLLTFALRLD